MTAATSRSDKNNVLEKAHPPRFPSDEFWNMLLETGAVTEEFAERYRRSRKPLGAILIKNGYVTIKGVSRLLSIQAEYPTLRMGELAVREGYCTPEDIVAAVSEQLGENGSLDEALVSDETVNQKALIMALVALIERLERRNHHSQVATH